MAISAKSLSLMQELKDRLARRTTLAVTDLGFDTDGGALLQVGTGAIGSQSMLIKAKQIDPLGFDGIGLAARGYAQTVIQIGLEATAVANTAILTAINNLNVLGEVLRQGSRVELYMSANGVAPVAGTLVVGNLKATWEPDLQYRTMDAQ